MEIMAADQEPVWREKTIRFAGKCSWSPGRHLAERMRDNDFADWEKVFAAVQDGEVTGFCVFENDGRIPEEFDCHPFINLVFVDEGYRGQRISEKLITAALQYAEGLGYRKVYLKSEHRGLYEKYGFRKIADFVPVAGRADQLFEIGINVRGTDRDLSEMTILWQIRERGVLKAGTTGDYRPLSYPDPVTGGYAGFDAELAEDLADELGVGIEYVKTSWSSLMADTAAGRFDLAVCGITISDARKEQALLSDGYLVNGKTILCRAEDADRYTGIDDVNRPGVRVMVNPGGLNEQFAREHLPDAALMIHEANPEIPAMVACGQADIMITETVEAGYYAGLDDRLAAPLIREPFTHGELGILMPKGSEDLLDYVNGFLRKEKESGRIDELAHKYLCRQHGT
ncbi:MAG: GNAT family N-acetyltransferase [Solobacterium sp.]|nr:GNAT family N-acetyltransferase [Solobacterium sp.]